MFKKTLLSTAAASALCLAAPAHADYYVSVFGGVGTPDSDGFQVGPFSRTTQGGTTGSQRTKVIAGTVFVFPRTPYTLLMLSGSFKNRAHTVYTWSTTVGSFREDEFDSGFVVGAALGYNFVDGWRAELELSWRQNDVGGNHRVAGVQSYGFAVSTAQSFIGKIYFYTTPPSPPLGTNAFKSGTYTAGNPYIRSSSYVYRYTPALFSATARTDGEVTTFALMANLWYDFDLGDRVPVTPFVGVGIGVANVNVDYAGRIPSPTNTIGSYFAGPYTFGFRTETDDYVFAWQVGAGLAYEFANGMSLSAQYRYFSAGDITVAGQDFGIQSHEALIGLRVPLGN